MISVEQKALNARFLAAYDYLESIGRIRKNLGVRISGVYSRADAGTACFGVPNNYVTMYMVGVRSNKRLVPFDGAIRFCHVFGLNKYWMIFGEGEMIDEQKNGTP